MPLTSLSSADLPRLAAPRAIPAPVARLPYPLNASHRAAGLAFPFTRHLTAMRSREHDTKHVLIVLRLAETSTSATRTAQGTVG